MAVRALLTSVSANTTTQGIQMLNTGHPAVHTVTLLASGTFAGATVKAQIGISSSTDGTFWTDIENGSMTASSAANFDIADGYYFRVVVASASAGATALNAWMATGRSTSK